MSDDLLTALWQLEDIPTFSPVQWEALLGQARRARLLPRLARHCADRNWLHRVPEAPRRHLCNALLVLQRQRNETLWEIDRIRSALVDVPTRVVLLKGAAYVAAGLAPSHGRVFSDIDILVTRQSLPAVESALMSAGWIPSKLDAYDDRYYREWSHELPPLQHVQRQTALDVHHTIAAPTSRYKIDGALLMDSAVPIGEHEQLAVLAPADMVLHSVVHLLQEGDFSGGLRDLLDIRDLLDTFGKHEGFWPKLLQRAKQLGVEVPLYYALTHARRILGSEVPADWMGGVEALGPSPLRRRLMHWALSAALRPDHPSCEVPSGRWARWCLYVRSHHLRMPWYQIGPHLIRKAWMRSFAGRREEVKA